MTCATALTEAQKRRVKALARGGEPCADLLRPAFVYSPEQSLWSACLYEAVQTYLGVGILAGHKDRSEVRTWFGECGTDESRGARPGSFEWVCLVLDIDPASFRRSLFRMERGSRQPASGGQKVAHGSSKGRCHAACSRLVRAWWILPLEAMIPWRPDMSRPPRRSVTVPPASSIMRMPAATSHGERFRTQ